MSFVTTQPEALTAAASALQTLGTSLTDQNAAAAVPTTGVLPAAADPVSALQAAQFSAYGAWYQQVSAQAAAIHQMLVNTLQSSAGSYGETEGANQTATGSTSLSGLLGGLTGGTATSRRRRRPRRAPQSEPFQLVPKRRRCLVGLHRAGPGPIPSRPGGLGTRAGPPQWVPHSCQPSRRHRPRPPVPSWRVRARHPRSVDCRCRPVGPPQGRLAPRHRWPRAGPPLRHTRRR